MVAAPLAPVKPTTSIHYNPSPIVGTANTYTVQQPATQVVNTYTPAAPTVFRQNIVHSTPNPPVYVSTNAFSPPATTQVSISI